MPGSPELLWNLAGWSIRATALAAAAGLLVLVCRVRDVSARLTIWTVVLCGALITPLLSSLAPAVDIPIPKWQDEQPAPAAMPSMSVGPSVSFVEVPARGREPSPAVNWPLLLTALWAAAAAAMLGQLALGIRCGRRLVRTAIPVDVPGTVRIYESESVRVPITIGSLHPAIVLPPGWRAWDQRKLAAVLAHESAHVRRHDPLRQLLASIYRAIFWFHPLSWWLHRELAELAESASDDAALAATSDETFYAEVLLHFVASAPRRVQWNAVAMALRGKATKRMERILNTGRKLSRGLSRPAAAAIVIAALPALYVVSSGTPVWAVVNGQEPPPAPVAPAPPASGIVGGVPGGVRGGVPALAPEPPAPPEPPEPPQPPEFNWDGADQFAIVTGDTGQITGSLGPATRDRLAALRKKMGTDFLWFQRDGGEYIVRDPATVAQLKEAFDAIGRQGSAMEKQGSAQAEAARKLEEAVREQIQPHQAELERLAADMERRAREIQAQIGNDENMKRLESQMRDLEKQMRAKETEFRALEKQFSDTDSGFAKVQRELEKQMKSMEFELNRKVGEAQELLKRLEDQALSNKKAEKII